MTDPSKAEIQREVELRRAAFASSLEAVATRVESGADRVHGALVKVQTVKEEGRALVTRHPLVFVAASVGLGLAFGLMAGGRRRRRAREAAIAAQVVAPMAAAVVEPQRSSLLWSAAGFVGRLALQSVVDKLTAVDEPSERG